MSARSADSVPAAAPGITTPIRDLGGAVVDLGRDFWLTFSAPVRMDRDAWLATGAVLGVAGLLYLADEDITRAVLRNENEPIIGPILDTGTFLEPIGLMGNTNIWYATGAVASWAVGWDRPNRMFTELLYSHWIAAVIRGATNRVVGRSRPHDERGADHFAIGGGTSFPSGHASTIFQVAAVLAYHIDWTPASIGLYGLATTVALQRISDQQHWASDVWLGAAYGWAVARLVISLHEDDAVRIEPAPGPDGHPALAIRVRF
jgi:membrane-associated phospholipid phosphatase